MNKVILMGRLTRDCEVRYSSGAEPMAVVRFSIAVNRRFKREGEPDADFFNCVAFGKTGETINRYFKKGSMISIMGHIQNGSYTDKDGNKKYTTDIIIDEFYFCGGSSAETKNSAVTEETVTNESELPF
ncbi:MAG: single-stranded DNA-binding protein [bacterium]|nr:single-stranded DNA-binding protein [bacterium]